MRNVESDRGVLAYVVDADCHVAMQLVHTKAAHVNDRMCALTQQYKKAASMCPLRSQQHLMASLLLSQRVTETYTRMTTEGDVSSLQTATVCTMLDVHHAILSHIHER